MTPEELTDNAIKYLNNLYNLDKSAIHALCVNRVPCNSLIADHPHAVVDITPVPMMLAYPNLGMLGVINGLLTSVGATRVVMKWEVRPRVSPETRSVFLGFDREPVQVTHSPEVQRIVDTFKDKVSASCLPTPLSDRPGNNEG